MTLSMPRKNKRGELPKNIRKGLIAHAEGVTWEDSADLAGVSTYEMKQWRAHPQAQSLIDTAMNLNLEESLGTLAQATPALANRLINIALDPKVKDIPQLVQYRVHLTLSKVELLIERIR